MQPLWLFDRAEMASIPDYREEILFSLLALALCHSKHPFLRGRVNELSETYAQAAREHLMQRVAKNGASLSTVQGLCMLALANLQGMLDHCQPTASMLTRPISQQCSPYAIAYWSGGHAYKVCQV
jgi:hypothetical protein